MLIFIEKSSNRIALYGSIKVLFDREKELVKISLNHFYNTIKIEEEDWSNEFCSIHKRSIVRSRHKQIL